MRLWHQDIITALPRQQLLRQHRECCALRGKGWGKNHSVVNYVFTYSMMRLYYYHMQVMFEMKNRGYKVEAKWQDPHYRGKTIGYDYSIDHHEQYIGHFYREHDESYMKECLNNLAGKGIIIKEVAV